MKKMLLIDDDAAVRAALSLRLNQEGYGCTCCPCGNTALSVMQKDPHPLVLADVKMPGLEENHLLKEMKKLHRSAKVLMMSDELQDEHELFLLGAMGFYRQTDGADRLLAQLRDMEQDRRVSRRLTAHFCFLAGAKPAVTLNISSDGMLFQSRTGHQEGSFLDISLISKNEFLDVKAKVLRSDLCDTLYHTALYFQENVGHFLCRNKKIFL